MKYLIVFSAVIMIAVSAFGQGMGRRMMYDQSNVTTFTGTVQSVDTLTGRGGNFQMIMLTVKVKSGTERVHVGPVSFIEKEKFSFKTGDAVEVTGSKVDFNGSDVIMAAKVKDGGKELTLRDESGRPLWARRGMR